MPEDTERSAPRPTPTHGPNTQGPSRELRYRIPFALRLSMWRVPVPLGACQSGVSTANIRRAKRTGSGALSMSLIRRLGGCRRFTPLWRATQNTVARKAIHPYSGLVAYPSHEGFSRFGHFVVSQSSWWILHPKRAGTIRANIAVRAARKSARELLGGSAPIRGNIFVARHHRAWTCTPGGNNPPDFQKSAFRRSSKTPLVA